MTFSAFFANTDGALSWQAHPPLEPGAHQLVISVHAAGVNRPDLLQRKGLYPPPPGASEALGLEVAGVVKTVGEGARRFKPGDRVMALLPGGGYAQEALADEGCTMALPRSWSFEQGAAFPETAFTVWANVFEAGRLAKGETLFLHGATSGIGTMAASIAKALNLKVYATAGTTAKVAEATALGYEKVWNYNDDDWSAGMAAAGGADVVLDMVGGDYVPRNLKALKDGGRHVSIAFLRGAEATINVMHVMRRRLILTGSTLRARPLEDKTRLRAEIEANLFPLIAAGKLAPVIGLTLPMAEADRAHQAMAEGQLRGKAVLTAPR